MAKPSPWKVGLSAAVLGLLLPLLVQSQGAKVCNICGEGNEITKPKNSVTAFGITASCQEFQDEGEADQFCSSLPTIVKDQCACRPIDGFVPPKDAPVSPPTARPVASPTIAPLPDPTNDPVPEPTNAPVIPPTTSPIPEPTKTPVKPTNAPAVKPTTEPVVPTPRPTQAPPPTDAPVVPTPRPTRAPQPTNPPVDPTPRPTRAPRPTNPPVSPTPRPTREPFTRPTNRPVTPPTRAPIPAPPPRDFVLTLPETPLNFDDFDIDFTRLSLQSARLSASIISDNTKRDFPTATVFTEEPDKAMVVKLDNICFGVFRATLANSPVDILTNFDATIVNNVCFQGQCCPTREGYRDAFSGPSYFPAFDAAFRSCVRSCGSQRCDVVLTGFSQGGAAAQVAGIVYRDTNPIVITFGQPPATQLPCRALNEDRYFRYITTIDRGNELIYDPIPFFFLAGVKNYGSAFVLGETPQRGIAFYEGQEAPELNIPDDYRDTLFTVHDIDLYIRRLQLVLNRNRFPVPLTGFSRGSRCRLSSECQFPDVCGNNVCTPGDAFRVDVTDAGAVGESCRDIADCLPGNYCDGFFQKTCQRKGGPGATCRDRTECQSGFCRGRRCA